MKNYFTILCIIIYWSSFSQTKEFDFQKKYTVNQILKDIDYTEKYLIKFHPDPFRYISKDSLHAFVLEQKNAITRPLTEMQVRFYIRRIIAKIGCGHTDVAASKNYTKSLKKASRPILPINVFITDTNKLFVLNNLSHDSTITPGDEILSIDNHPTEEIFKTLYAVISSDGYNETYKKQSLQQQWFKYYYSFCYGFKPNYLIKTKSANNTIKIDTLTNISSLKDTLILPKHDTINYLLKTKTCFYYHLKTDTTVAVIDINSFKGTHWRKFFRKTFKDINKSKINHLVIDLRDNGGGKIINGLNALSYMIDEKIKLPFERKPNFMFFNPKYKMGIASRITPVLFSTIFPQRIKNGKLQHYFCAIKKHRNKYKGEIYVLINGKSFSMSCIAASYLKYKANAIIIGEETGGNVAGSNAVIKGGFILPSTKIRVYTPAYHIYHDINVTNNGYGIEPTYPINYTKQAVLNGEDLEMKKVIELVN
jgi:hypothetical protein